MGSIEQVPQEGYEMTKYFEGWRPDIYKDTKGKNTVGYGFNVDEPAIAQFLPKDVVSGARQLDPREAETIYNTLYQKSLQDAYQFAGDNAYNAMSPKQFSIIADMAYNLGPNKLAEFKQMQKALQSGDWAGVAREMQDSKWYKQTGRRGKHHVTEFPKGGK